MCRFLRFVVERQLAGRRAELKEYTIGVEVFDRDSRYDPRVDPIVRVEARRLRSKLEAYYHAEGRSDELVIDLPKGSYVPVFRAARASGAASAQAADSRSIAVLPFANASSDPEHEYLSDGLTQQIIHRLTRVHGLRVVGWNSASRMREERDLAEAARALSAATVLVGSVRTSGGRLRVTSQLVDVASGAYLWSEVYDRLLEDLLVVEEEIARSIVDALSVQLGFVRAETGNPRAYELYFKARYYWNKRTADGLRRAMSLFREALDIDPSFALAWAGLADTYVLIGEYALLPPSGMMEAARKAAEQALRLSPCLGEAESSLAMVRCLYDWEWDDAETHFRRAIDLNPGYATAFHWYAVDYLSMRARHEESLEAIDVALNLEPLASIIRENRGYILLLARRIEEAAAEYRRVLDVDPGFYKAWTSLGRAYIQLGRLAEAMEALERGRELLGESHPSILGALGQAYAQQGNLERARECLGELTRIAQTSHVTCSSFAAVYIGLRNPDAALEALKNGCNHRDAAVAAIGVHPLYDPLRSDPRFIELVRRVGCLPQ